MGRLGWGITAVISLLIAALGAGIGFGVFPGLIDSQIEAALNFWDETQDARQNFVRLLKFISITALKRSKCPKLRP